MDLLIGDKDYIISKVIDAFTEIYGEEYYPQIFKKLSNALIISYIETKELKGYIYYLDKYLRSNLVEESEYLELKNKLVMYENYVKSEEKRKENIIADKRKEILLNILPILPLQFKKILMQIPIDLQKDIVLGRRELNVPSTIEFFSSEQIKKLSNPDISDLEKKIIIDAQITLLTQIGISMPYKISDYGTDEFITNYIDFINNPLIKSLILDDNTVNFIKNLRTAKYDEMTKEYYNTNEYFNNVTKLFGNNDDIKTFFYNIFTSNFVGVYGKGIRNPNNDFISLMFFTIRSFDNGRLMYSFMHECGHVIDQNINGCGFEPYNAFTNSNIDGNKQDGKHRKYRKYERFNETLNDIFTIEAVNYLQNQGVYLFEPKCVLAPLSKLNNSNTSSVLKEILYPLIDKYRMPVIKAKVSSNPLELTKYIGSDNYESLVDALNNVDYYINSGVLSLLETNPEDNLVIRYQNELNRIDQIYYNIDNYYSKISQKSKMIIN